MYDFYPCNILVYVHSWILGEQLGGSLYGAKPGKYGE